MSGDMADAVESCPRIKVNHYRLSAAEAEAEETDLILEPTEEGIEDTSRRRLMFE